MSPMAPGGVHDPLENVDTRDPDAVVRLLDEAAKANREASCRAGSVDRIANKGVLVATGDLHDNPVHFARVLALAQLDRATEQAPRHVTLHEVVHGELRMGGVDFSHRALLRVAALKRDKPEYVHTLLANHELSQIVGAGVVKNGAPVREAFNEGVRITFGQEEASRVLAAIERFIRSMPLALLTEAPEGERILCAHSLPSPVLMDRFDESVLERDLVEEDYEPRRGAAHLMVWGRGHTPEQLERLARRWGVGLFILGHEHVEEGWRVHEPDVVTLNSDHDKGKALEIPLGERPDLEHARAWLRNLADEDVALRAAAQAAQAPQEGEADAPSDRPS